MEYKCPVCDKTFREKIDITKHILTEKATDETHKKWSDTNIETEIQEVLPKSGVKGLSRKIEHKFEK